MQAVGSADDPSSAVAARCRRHWGERELNLVTQSSPTGSQCIPAVGCAEAARYIVRRPQLGLRGARRRAHVRVARRGGVQRGRVLGEPQHGVQPAPAGALRRARQRLRHLGADHRPAPGAGGRAGAPASAGLDVHRLDGTDYFGVRTQAAARSSSGSGPASGPALHPRRRRAARTRTRRPTRRASTARPTSWPTRRARDPIDRLERELVDGGVLTAEQAAELRAEAKEIVAKAAAEALAAPAARPGPRHRARVRAARRSPTPPADLRGRRAGADGRGDPRTLHEVMAADERIRVFGEDVADARRRCWPTSRARAACSAPRTACSAPSGRPAASTRRCRRPTSSAGPSGRPCAACGRRPRSSSSTTSGRP